jgi:gliding motility-associated-like protein
VPVSVNDGQHESNKFDLKIEVLKKEANVAPTIIGQRPINITQSTPFTLQLFDLIVDDPDNDFPTDFVLKIFPGTNYTINGTSITPAASLVSGTLTVKVKVNDGRNDSPLFEVKIQITPISATPRINGQRELTMMEDSTFTLKLTDLVVTDADNPAYPRGFTLNILSDGEGVYKASGKTITLAPDLNGLIEVGVTVSDGKNTSDEYRVVIFVEPVNDAPRLTLKDNSPLNYEPGKMPADLFSRLELVDVDNEFLSMAEIGFRQPVFSGGNDEILFEFDTTKIRVIRDPSGILFLIGYAKVEEYQAALRSMKYNYRITLDQNGEPEGILTGSRTIYVNVNDGQSISVDTERKVNLEGRVVLDIPTAFTPNGDNANDTWHLKVSNRDLLDQTTIRVYNKRGLLIFESNRLDREWDGRYHGELVPSETYYYTIIVDVPYSKQTFSGVVTILY